MSDRDEGGFHKGLAGSTYARCHPAESTLWLFIRVRLRWGQVHQMYWPKHRLCAATIWLPLCTNMPGHGLRRQSEGQSLSGIGERAEEWQSL
jgi:hypothetical protein